MGRVERAVTAAARKISRKQLKKMPETTVPVSLRDAFLEDPFFRTGWDEMNSKCREMRSFAEGNNTLATMDRSWPLLPKQWMLPQLFQDFHLPEMKDSLMLGLQEEKDKMEVTLDTSGYKPDELKVEIKGGELCVEGKHEERSQSGEVMVSRQFSRRFGLPQNVKKEDIVSNLSQDGVMVITMPKEQRIEEVERGSTPIQVDHVRSSAERKTEEVSSREKKSQDITNEGRVDNFEGPGEMQRRRRSLSKAGRSMDTSRARETITSAINAKENKESKASGTRSSSRGHEMVVERKEERRERGRSRARDLQVPMTLRQPFLDDPFFKGTLKSLESTRDDFFKQARQSFEESLKQMESRMSNALILNTQGSDDSLFPKDWMKPPAPLTDNFGSMLERKQDCSTIKHNEDDNKVEVHLDTSGYKPDELKVQVEGSTVRVEGKHEERSQAGAVMVSRQFVKEYALPEGSKPEGVESSLSKDGVLVITMPKPRKAINTDKSRSVPIAIK